VIRSRRGQLVLIFESVWEGNIFFVFLVLVRAVCGVLLREIREQQRSQPANHRKNQTDIRLMYMHVSTFRDSVS
jgi:hypothetical protein